MEIKDAQLKIAGDCYTIKEWFKAQEVMQNLTILKEN